MLSTVDVDVEQILYKYTWPHCIVHSIIQVSVVEMFSLLRDKAATSYDPIPNDGSSIVHNARSQTTLSMSHLKQYSNGTQFYITFHDSDRNVY
jgi:cyclophilin family peptidyl-prolyl cis-trans isomerase